MSPKFQSPAGRWVFSINPSVCSDSQGTVAAQSPPEGHPPSPGPGCQLRAAGPQASAGQLPPVRCGLPMVSGASGGLGDLSRPGSPGLFLLCSCFPYIQTFGPGVFLFNVLCCGHNVERSGSGHSQGQLCLLASLCSVTCTQKTAQVTNPGHFQN